MKQAGLFEDAHHNHHAHEQKDDIHIHGAHGIFKGQDKKILVKGARRVGNEQNNGRAQKGRQGAVHQFGGDDHVNQQQDCGRQPKGRGDLALHGQLGLGLKEVMALGVGAHRHEGNRGGAKVMPGAFGGLDLQTPGREAAGGKEENRQETPLLPGDDLLFLALGFEMPTIEQHLHLHLFDSLSLKIPDGAGHAQAVFGGGLGSGGEGRRNKAENREDGQISQYF